MGDTIDKNLALIEQELRFISRQSQEIEGSYDIVDGINFAIISALRALQEYKMKRTPKRDEVPAGDALAA
jgi:hypothetical protein